MLDHDDTREPACTVLDCEPDHVNHLACPRVWPLRRLINRHLNYSFRALDVTLSHKSKKATMRLKAPTGPLLRANLGLTRTKPLISKNAA